jgi:peptidoglycan/xylan/chitin deacetylase (PgdA/CDA1 family)
MHIEPTQPWAEAKMKAPIPKRIKDVIGRAAGKAGILGRDFRSKMIIVAFHRINDGLPGALICSSEKFEKFCEFFRAQFKVTALSEQIAGCNAGKDMGGTLSITLDDGYRDNCEVAAPILRKLGLPATFFVTTGFIGTQTVAFWDQQLPRAPGWMDWDQVRSLVSQGFEIGCHTHTHIDLGTADEQTAWAELELSKRTLHEQLGRPTPLFAYPFGGRDNISARSRELVRKAGFVCCAAGFGGVNPRTGNAFDLNRISMGPGFVTPAQFGLDILLNRV